MSDDIPPPTRHCTACDAGHYVAVRFCPFCGAEQEQPAVRPEPIPPVAPIEPATAYLRLEAQPPKPASGPISVAPSPIPTVPHALRTEAPRPGKRRRPATYRNRFGLRGVIFALLAIIGLAALALARRDALPTPARIAVGPAWASVALGPLRGVPLLRLTGDGPFIARLDGDRILRIAPGSGATMRVKTLRGLELRTGRGSVTVTLTPRRE